MSLFDSDMNTTLINERFVLRHKSPPENYEAYLYRVHIEYMGEDTPPWGDASDYIGYHMGPIEDAFEQKYLTSSKDVNEVISHPLSKITYEIFDYGTGVEMGTAESALLKKAKAKSNSKYFNKNHGGGRYCVSIIDHTASNIEDVLSNIKSDKYKKVFYDRKKLKSLNSIQVRKDELDSDHVETLRLTFLDKSDPKDIEPIVVLMPPTEATESLISKMKSSVDSVLEHLIGGNHRRAAAYRVPIFPGLYAIQIPFEDWYLLSDNDLRYLGLRLNPVKEKPELEMSYDDMAINVIGMILEHNLYVKDSKGNDIPNYKHDIIVDRVEKGGFTGSRRGEVTKRAKALWKKREWAELGANFVDFSEKGLKNNPRAKKWYDKKVKSVTDLVHYDRVFKVTGEADIWQQIFKTLIRYDHKGRNSNLDGTKIYVFIYARHMSSKESSVWEQVLSEFKFRYEEFYKSKIKMEFEILPHNSLDLKGYNDD